MMRIYHGSPEMNLRPQFGMGKQNNDFGRGFYCTPDIERAKEWACKLNTPGYVYEYYLNTDGLDIMDLSDGSHSILEWFSILIANRVPRTRNGKRREKQIQIVERYLPDLSTYDVIIGARADDSYFTFAMDFLSGEISLRQLRKAMELGNLGKQVVLISEQSFDALEHVKTHQVDETKYYDLYSKNDIAARREYDEMVDSDEHNDDIYIDTIIEEKWEVDDVRLF